LLSTPEAAILPLSEQISETASLWIDEPLVGYSKASQISHVEENAGAGTLQLTEAEIGRIDAAFPAGRPRRRNVPML